MERSDLFHVPLSVPSQDSSWLLHSCSWFRVVLVAPSNAEGPHPQQGSDRRHSQRSSRRGWGATTGPWGTPDSTGDHDDSLLGVGSWSAAPPPRPEALLMLLFAAGGLTGCAAAAPIRSPTRSLKNARPPSSGRSDGRQIRLNHLSGTDALCRVAAAFSKNQL